MFQRGTLLMPFFVMMLITPLAASVP